MSYPAGESLHQAIMQLFPIMRSITGPGVRESLGMLQEIAPIEIHAVASGTQVLDWTVPDEWYFSEGWIADASGQRRVDSIDNNLHVVNFSVPVDGVFSLEELLPHLHYLEDRPDSIPYRTSYYAEQWGFCLSKHQFDSLGPGPFHVKIEAERVPGELNYGQIFIPGKKHHEILVSTHVCHPQLANDNLSGMVLAAKLASLLLDEKPELSWRFVFVPGTIGAISWLAEQTGKLSSIVGGTVITGLGDCSQFHWKKTPDGKLWIDRLVQQVLSEVAPQHHQILDFSPYGYDERQYCSPGFDLPVGRLTRGVHGTFPEYHTSDDNLDFVCPEGLEQSLELLQQIARSANQDKVYRNLSPFGEPHLGKRGIYGSLGAQTDPGRVQMCFLWLLNQSDGTRSLSQIAARSEHTMEELERAADILVQHQLLEVVCHACEL